MIAKITIDSTVSYKQKAVLETNKKIAETSPKL